MAGATAPLRKRLEHHPVHGIERLGAPYIMGVHPNRLKLSNYRWELKTALRRPFSGRSKTKKFVILSLPRSGTTLLVRMLNQLPQVKCLGEVLINGVAMPRRFINGLADLAPTEAFGCKILAFHLLETVWTRDPLGLIEGLHDDGFKLILLERELFSQSLSLSWAFETGEYHRTTAITDGDRADVALDPEQFEKMLQWNRASLDWLKLLLSELPHLHLNYERDLKDVGSHQATVDRIATELGVDSGPVEADLYKVTSADGRKAVSNIDALREVAARQGSV